MKKTQRFMRTFVLLLLALAMILSAVGCKREQDPENKTEGQKYDPETRPLAMSISTPDGVFNPFFATSAYDSTILGMTQVSMLGTNPNGEIVCGDNEPVVVKDYRIVTDEDQEYSTYNFIIKNGIKFSDGVPLTIKDVLFNLYVYLDPSYTGSATIYSTKIVGLEQYRMQTDKTNIGDSAMDAFEEGFEGTAKKRIEDLINYVKLNGVGISSNDRPDVTLTDAQIAQCVKDYETVSATFFDELTTDWNTHSSSKESYADWGFTETWQIFMLNDGQATELLKRDGAGKLIKDKDGNYQLDTDAVVFYEESMQEYLSENGYTSENREEGIRNWAINEVYSAYFPGTVGKTNAPMFESILRGWMTADTIRDKFTAEAKSEFFKNSDKVVPSISGITTSTTTKDFSGNDLGEEHSVLNIRIKGVDPKAIWNFAFTVAPMHYYSTNNWNGKDYIAAFDPAKGEFGLEFGSIEFMEQVINAPDKVKLPVGAGVYMASSATLGGKVTGDTFYDKNMIYYERNPYFETLGSGISNAKIKYLRYKVVESDQIINAIIRGDIDFGDPSATQDNIKLLNDNSVAHEEVFTSGYGYVGINPRYVPNITVRRAIMKAMDTSLITSNYYQGGLAELIWRPMSTTSWAYPKGCSVYTNADLGLDYSFDQTGYEIQEMIEAAGYQKNADGVYEKNIPGFGVDRLDYKFTIAGASVDHPAYAMFIRAANILNQIGFDVKVVSSQTALSDLSSGKLEVWAAAWSSTIDPDMYQVYHKDSQATSVNNWGYKQIKANKDLYAAEWAIINDLSDLIDDGRSTTEVSERKDIYAKALDKVMELAVEMPTYQRKDMSAYNKDVIDASTMTPKTELSPYNGLLSRIWELNYN